MVTLNGVSKGGLPEKGASELKGVTKGREPCGLPRPRRAHGEAAAGKATRPYPEGAWAGQTRDEATRGDTARLWAFCQVR